MTKFKSLLALCLLTLIWLLIWSFFTLNAATLYSSQFNYSQITASPYQCLHVNLFRSVLYLTLFYGQLLIFKAISSGKMKFADYFKFTFKRTAVISNLIILKDLRNQSISNNLKLILKNIVWIFYWYSLSLMLYWFTSDHFMGDCDDGDLECTCNNIPYLLPVLVVTLLIGCIYITSMNYQKNKGSLDNDK